MVLPNPWISCPQPRPGARARLFCFPYAGGGASVFRNWWRAFRRDIEVCSILPPGREQRLAEKPFTEFPPYAEALTASIVPWLDRPFAFFGHSLGALAAFECARLLRKQSHSQPMALFASACRAPQIPFRDRRTRSMSDNLFIEELRSLGGSPPEALEHPELMALLLPVVRADFAVYESYEFRPDDPLAVPIHVFGGTEDLRVTRADLVAWSEQTTAQCSVRTFPGDHFFLHPAQRALVEAVGDEIERRLSNANG